MNLKNIFLLLFSMLLAGQSYARGGGGGHSIGLGVGLAAVSQADLDSLADNSNTQGGGRSAAKISSGLEFEGHYQYRFSGTMFALQFRPSYFTQSGKGSTDTHSLTGLAVFPMLRLYPLENNFIHFYMQVGFGYGRISGKIEQPVGTVEFAGSAFGSIAGLGAEFCFTDMNCLYVEGDGRYLPFNRNLVTSKTGTPTGLSQTTNGQELEINGTDLSASMSGILGMVGYHMNF